MKRILAGLMAAAIGAFALVGGGGAHSASAQAATIHVDAGNGNILSAADTTPDWMKE